MLLELKDQEDEQNLIVIRTNLDSLLKESEIKVPVYIRNRITNLFQSHNVNKPAKPVINPNLYFAKNVFFINNKRKNAILEPLTAISELTGRQVTLLLYIFFIKHITIFQER